MRRAMTLRTAVCGIRWSPGAVTIGCAAGALLGALAAAGEAAPGLAPSTSAFTIRPFGPEPLIPARLTPFSAAMRLASGEAKRRAPPDDAGACGAGAAFGADGAGAAAGVAAGALGFASALAGAAAMGADFSPSSNSTAI